MEEKLTEILENVTAFTQGELPKLAEELILFEQIKSGASAVFFCILFTFIMFVTGLAYFRDWDEQIEEQFDVPTKKSVIIVFAAIFGTMPFVLFVTSCFDFIQTVVAPRAFLLEYPREFLN